MGIDLSSDWDNRSEEDINADDLMEEYKAFKEADDEDDDELDEAQLNELNPMQKAMKQGAITTHMPGAGRGAAGPDATSAGVKRHAKADTMSDPSHRRADKMFKKGPRGTAAAFDKGAKAKADQTFTKHGTGMSKMRKQSKSPYKGFSNQMSGPVNKLPK